MQCLGKARICAVIAVIISIPVLGDLMKMLLHARTVVLYVSQLAELSAQPLSSWMSCC